ncbi:MAG: ABC transporter permease [Aristaeellaceae bacterium]
MSRMDMKGLMKKNGTQIILASLLSIVIGMLAGSIIITIVGLTNDTLGIKGVWDGIRIVFLGLFIKARDAAGNLVFAFNPQMMGNMLFRAIPVILTGLSVALANKTGLFNIGASGQYLAGTAATLFIALSMPVTGSEMTAWQASQGIAHAVTFPAWFVWCLAFVGGMLAGALWGAIPGLLKALLNINEVLACIMTNWIAANLVTWAFDMSSLKNVVENTKTGYIYKTSFNGVETAKMGLDKLFPGSQVNGGILIAAVLAVAVFIMLSRTTFGYELKACGSNRLAARYAGIRDKQSIVISMAIAGALAGAAGSLYYLAGNTEFFWSTYQSLPAEGFNGIPVALLAANNPVAVIFTGMFMSMLNICGLQLKNLTNFNEYITDVIIAVIVYLSAFSLVMKMLIGKIGQKRSGKEDVK